MAHEGIPLPLIQRQLGHANLSTTGTYLEGISTEEIISTVHGRAIANNLRQRWPPDQAVATSATGSARRLSADPTPQHPGLAKSREVRF